MSVKKHQGILFIILAGFFFALMSFFRKACRRPADNAESFFQKCGGSGYISGHAS